MVKFAAWDNAGNTESVQSQLVDIDSQAPTSGITCNSAACSVGWYRTSVKVALNAADTGGSGVATIHYTTDGSAPTAGSPVYAAPLTLSSTKTVKTLAVDNAGNAGPVRSAVVRIDKTRPTVRISGPKYHASVTGRVTITAVAADAQSGVARVLFYIDGKLKAIDTKAPYAFTWNTAGLKKKAHAVTVHAIDKAGNVTSVTITVFVH
jgi:hypothetical protein